MRFLTTNRKMLVDTIKLLYLNKTNNLKNLPIYGVKTSNLVNFEKTDLDIKKGILSRVPGEETRLKEEDLINMKQESIRKDIPDLDLIDESIVTNPQASTAQPPKDQDDEDERWQICET